MQALTDITTVEDLQANWRDQYLQWWAAGMPSFEQPDTLPWKKLTVRFKSKEDRAHFAEVLGEKFTDKTNSVHFPVKSSEAKLNSLYVEDGYELPHYKDSKQ